MEGGRTAVVDVGDGERQQGQWLWMVIEAFWSFYNEKYSLLMRMLDSYKRRWERFDLNFSF